MRRGSQKPTSPEKEMSGNLVSVSTHSAEGAVRDRGSAQEALGRQELVRRVKPPLPLFKVSHRGCHRKPDVPTRDRLTLHIEIKPGEASKMAQCVDMTV